MNLVIFFQICRCDIYEDTRTYTFIVGINIRKIISSKVFISQYLIEFWLSAYILNNTVQYVPYHRIQQHKLCGDDRGT